MRSNFGVWCICNQRFQQLAGCFEILLLEVELGEHKFHLMMPGSKDQSLVEQIDGFVDLRTSHKVYESKQAVRFRESGQDRYGPFQLRSHNSRILRRESCDHPSAVSMFATEGIRVV